MYVLPPTLVVEVIELVPSMCVSPYESTFVHCLVQSAFAYHETELCTHGHLHTMNDLLGTGTLHDGRWEVLELLGISFCSKEDDCFMCYSGSLTYMS